MRLIHTILLLFLCFIASTQLIPHTLSTEFDNVENAVVGDIDGDGDMDIIVDYTSNYLLRQLGQNSGEFAPELIGGNSGPLTLDDVDSDGDLDLLIHHDDELEYLNNSDGLGDFEFQGIVTEMSETNIWPETWLVDIDKDGDLDLVSNGVSWRENLDGAYLFGEEQDIYITPSDQRITFDLNFVNWEDDNDMDIIINIEITDNQNQISLILNNGDKTFADPVVLVDDYDGWDWTHTKVIDTDEDGDYDIVVHDGPNDIHWFRNDDDIFSDQIFIQEYFDVPGNMDIFDVDNDGLKDLVWCGHGGVFYLLNEGGFTFNSDPITLNPSSTNNATNNILPSDIDQDGDLDIIAMGRAIGTFSQRLRWFENTYPTILSITDRDHLEAYIYPNPVRDHFTIETEFDIAVIINAQGQNVMTIKNKIVDISTLSKGVYLLNIESSEGEGITRIIKI